MRFGCYDQRTLKANRNYYAIRELVKNVKSANCEVFRNTEQVCEALGVCPNTLRKYRKLLNECAPDEFNHETGAHWYSQKSFEALEKVAVLFREKFTQKQIEEMVTSKGI